MIKLYLDEDVPETIALSLRLRGYDVVTVKETGRKGLADIEQIQYASSEKRVIFTHNIADFYKIHSDFISIVRLGFCVSIIFTLFFEIMFSHGCKDKESRFIFNFES